MKKEILDPHDDFIDYTWTCNTSSLISQLSIQSMLSSMNDELNGYSFSLSVGESFKCGENIVINAIYVDHHNDEVEIKILKTKCEHSGFNLYQIQAVVNTPAHDLSHFSDFFMIMGKILLDDLPMLNIKVVTNEDIPGINKNKVEINNAFITRNFDDCFIPNLGYILKAIKRMK